jgi:hypothetical protein
MLRKHAWPVKWFISLASQNNFSPLFQFRKIKGLRDREVLEDISVDDMIILKWILKLQYVYNCVQNSKDLVA